MTTTQWNLSEFTFLNSFRPVFEEYREHGGKGFRVLEHIQADLPPDESLGMFRITLSTGETIVAHPEEVVAKVNGKPYNVYSGGVLLS